MSTTSLLMSHVFPVCINEKKQASPNFMFNIYNVPYWSSSMVRTCVHSDNARALYESSECITTRTRTHAHDRTHARTIGLC